MDLKVLYFNQMLNVINRENKIIATNAWLLGRLSAPPDERKAALLIDFHILLVYGAFIVDENGFLLPAAVSKLLLQPSPWQRHSCITCHDRF